jgi:hypothetical protein
MLLLLILNPKIPTVIIVFKTFPWEAAHSIFNHKTYLSDFACLALTTVSSYQALAEILFVSLQFRGGLMSRLKHHVGINALFISAGFVVLAVIIIFARFFVLLDRWVLIWG